MRSRSPATQAATRCSPRTRSAPTWSRRAGSDHPPGSQGLESQRIGEPRMEAAAGARSPGPSRGADVSNLGGVHAGRFGRGSHDWIGTAANGRKHAGGCRAPASSPAPIVPVILAAVVSRLAAAGANIVTFDQFSYGPGRGSARTCDPNSSAQRPSGIASTMFDRASRRSRRTSTSMAAHPDKTKPAIFVSRSEHCLLDLLWRWRRGELHMDIAAVVSNHPDLEAQVFCLRRADHHIPVTPDTKAEAECVTRSARRRGRSCRPRALYADSQPSS